LKTRKYETIFIARPEYEKEQLEGLVQRLSDRIERGQGKLMEVSDWGLRRLAYPIRIRGEKFFYGRYLLLIYSGTGQTVKELEDHMKLIDDTFRFNSYLVSEEVAAIEQPEPVWREEVVPEIKLRDDGEGLEVVEPSRLRKLSKEEMYRPRAAEKMVKEEAGAAAPAEGEQVPAAEAAPAATPVPAPAETAPAETAPAEGEQVPAAEAAPAAAPVPAPAEAAPAEAPVEPKEEKPEGEK